IGKTGASGATHDRRGAPRIDRPTQNRIDDSNARRVRSIQPGADGIEVFVAPIVDVISLSPSSLRRSVEIESLRRSVLRKHFLLGEKNCAAGRKDKADPRKALDRRAQELGKALTNRGLGPFCTLRDILGRELAKMYLDGL